MATPREGNHPSDEGAPQPVGELQQLESRVARRRLSQARHRAALTGLFNNLYPTCKQPVQPQQVLSHHGLFPETVVFQ